MAFVSGSSAGNFRSGNIVRGEALGAADASVLLSTNNQFVSPVPVPGSVPVALIHVNSDNATATNRVFTLDNGQIMGQGLVLIFESATNSCTLVNTGNVKLSADWAPVQYQSLALEWNGSFWIELSRNPPAGVVSTTVALTQAQIISMFTTPVTILPTAATGTAYVVQSVEMFHSYSTAAYTGGGVVQLQYDTGAVALMQFAATLVTAASSLHSVATPTIYNLDASTGTGTGFSLANATAKSVTLTNGTAVFAAGNVANVLKVKITYSVVTVLS